MKECEEFAPLLSAFVDGELTEEERAEVLAHVSECEKCRRLLGELTALHAALGELEDEDVHLEVRDRAPTPEEHVEGRETQRLVREGLAALPEDYRRVLVLRELHQLSYAEICEVTELELGTVKSRINRARLLLRNYLAADGNFFEKPASKVTECNQTVGGERNAI